ncbi:MAG TPA: gluconate 2-dehydrogenase subunit 3 family protein [Burkholderiales bacterium]
MSKLGKNSGRRWFLKSVSAIGAAMPAAAALGADADPHHGHGAQLAQAARVKGQPQPQAYGWLTPSEAAFIEAAVARLIPADELGPGAKEAGVSFFIDQQLAGAYGTMARNYRQGPWPEGTPQQGYQSRLTPQEVYRAVIAEIGAVCASRFKQSFDELTALQQDEVLKEIETGKFELQSVSSSFFFNLLLANTIEGFFADPIYGGNRDKIGWKLVGFPGVAAAYGEYIERHNVPYVAVPVSIADVQQHVAELDEHGHPKHILLSSKD